MSSWTERSRERYDEWMGKRRAWRKMYQAVTDEINREFADEIENRFKGKKIEYTDVRAIFEMYLKWVFYYYEEMYGTIPCDLPWEEFSKYQLNVRLPIMGHWCIPYKTYLKEHHVKHNYYAKKYDRIKEDKADVHGDCDDGE